jgi:hypothetical protein
MKQDLQRTEELDNCNKVAKVAANLARFMFSASFGKKPTHQSFSPTKNLKK